MQSRKRSKRRQRISLLSSNIQHFPVDENPTEPSFKPNQPDPAHWQPYDHWRRIPTKDGVTRVWNSRYSVAISTQEQDMLPGPCLRVLIIRADQSAHHDYRDYMKIKDDLLGHNVEAIELYPARGRENDPSNAFVLFAFPKVPIGDNSGLVLNPIQAIAPQRPFQPTQSRRQ